jgi:hypothetical protein
LSETVVSVHQTTRCHATTHLYLPTRLDGATQYSPPPQTLISQQCHLLSPPDRTGPIARTQFTVTSVTDHLTPSSTSVGTTTTLWAGLPRNRASILCRGKRCFCFPQRLDKPWGPPSLLLNGYQGFLTAGLKDRGQSRPLRRLRMSGAVPGRPHSDNLQLPV